MAELVQYLKDEIELVLGGDWHETVNVFEDDEVTPKDTTGWSMTKTIFSTTNGEVYDTLTVANGKVTHTPASGQFNFDLTEATISAYEFKNAMYRDVVTYADGTKQTWRIGTIKVVS